MPQETPRDQTLPGQSSVGSASTEATLHRAALGSNDLINDSTPDASRQIERLIEIMRRLRDPAAGCPWDVAQDFATIAPYTIEEAYEVADAIERGAMTELEGELGDLLFQAVFHARMAEEAGLFDFAAVARNIADKMVARHPHVFGEESNDKSAEQQVADWESVKAAERAARSEGRVLDGVAAGLPALMRAVKLQKRAARVGFDWPEVDQVLAKLAEEAAEVVEARDTLGADAVEEEVGDLLFVVANLARHLQVDPETALRRANQKFIRRFSEVEDELARRGKSPAESDLAEMDGIWNQIRRADKIAAGGIVTPNLSGDKPPTGTD